MPSQQQQELHDNACTAAMQSATQWGLVRLVALTSSGLSMLGTSMPEPIMQTPGQQPGPRKSSLIATTCHAALLDNAGCIQSAQYSDESTCSSLPVRIQPWGWQDQHLDKSTAYGQVSCVAHQLDAVQAL